MESLEKVKTQAEEVLREAINMHLLNKDHNKLFMALGMGGLDPLFASQAILANYDTEKKQLDSNLVVIAIIAELRNSFKLPELKQTLINVMTAGDADLDSLDAYAECVFYIKVFSLSCLVKYYDQDIATTNQYKNILLAKKRQLAKFSKWGDVDHTEWVAYIQEFAIEKLYCGQIDSTIADFPEHVRLHINSVWMGSCSKVLIVYCLTDASNKNSESSTPTGHPSSNYDSVETGEDFESYIKELIEENIKGVTVELTPKTGDQGADLIVCGPNAKIVIQAKYYTGKVGNTAVQEVTAAKSYYQADLSVVVTNSAYTDSARSLAEKTNTILCSTDSLIPHIKLLV